MKIYQKKNETKLTASFILTAILLLAAYDVTNAQTINPTIVVSEPPVTQSPTNTPIQPTVSPQPNTILPTQRPYDWCNANGCGYNEHYKTSPVGASAGISVEVVASNSTKNSNQPASNQTTSAPTQTSAGKGVTTATSLTTVPVKPIRYFPSLSPLPSPTIYASTSAVPTPKPRVKLVQKQSFFDTMLYWLSRIFGIKQRIAPEANPLNHAFS